MKRFIALLACAVAFSATVVAAQVTPVMIPFDRNDSRLTATGRTTLDALARAYRQSGAGSVLVLAGHTSREGRPAANVQLSDRRAAVARDYLVSLGVPSYSITTQAFGETRPLVQTADGAREPRNDRVEITVGPGSGW